MNLKIESVLYSKNIKLRDATIEDSAFILDLRTDPNKNYHISKTVPSIHNQREWMVAYKSKEDQAYFIIENYQSDKLGCIRMYNPNELAVEWGSWLIVDGAPPNVALESALLIYDYAIRLGFKKVKIDVRQENESVWRFHEKVFSAKLISEDHINRFYEVNEISILKTLNKFNKFLRSRN